MKIKIQIDLAPIPYEHDISPLTGYLHMIVSEITKTEVRLNINDIDFFFVLTGGLNKNIIIYVIIKLLLFNEKI